MQLKPGQLRNDLKARQWPLYFVHGEEPLQCREAVDMLRKAARYFGYEDREVLQAEKGFDWLTLDQSAQSLSLFSSKRLLELHLPDGKPGDQGAKALIRYAEHPPQDTILLIIAGKLDASAKKTRWYKALDSVGVVVQAWPLNGRQLEDWLAGRLHAHGLLLEPDAVKLIAERVEGNMLAADQEIEKLALLYPDNQQLSLEQVEEAVLDSSRYNVFKLFDTALAGELGHALKMLGGLRQEGVAGLLVVSLLAREVRQLAQLSGRAAREGVDAAISKAYIFPARKALLKKTLQQRDAGQWEQLLFSLLDADKMAKGIKPGSPWDKLQMVLAAIAGQPYLSFDG